MFGAIIYLPVYLQVVRGVSPTTSGLMLLPIMAGLFTASIGSGQIIARVGRYKIFPILGTAFMTIGMGLFSTLDDSHLFRRDLLFHADHGVRAGSGHAGADPRRPERRRLQGPRDGNVTRGLLPVDGRRFRHRTARRRPERPAHRQLAQGPTRRGTRPRASDCPRDRGQPCPVEATAPEHSHSGHSRLRAHDRHGLPHRHAGGSHRFLLVARPAGDPPPQDRAHRRGTGTAPRPARPSLHRRPSCRANRRQPSAR